MAVNCSETIFMYLTSLTPSNFCETPSIHRKQPFFGFDQHMHKWDQTGAISLSSNNGTGAKWILRNQINPSPSSEKELTFFVSKIRNLNSKAQLQLL